AAYRTVRRAEVDEVDLLLLRLRGAREQQQRRQREPHHPLVHVALPSACSPYFLPGMTRHTTPSAMPASPSHVGMLTFSFSWTESCSGPILAWCVSLVKLKPPEASPTVPSTMRTIPTIFTGDMALLDSRGNDPRRYNPSCSIRIQRGRPGFDVGSEAAQGMPRRGSPRK